LGTQKGNKNQMTTVEEKITQIEEKIRTTPYHKGTEHYIGKLKAKLAKLREELEKKPARAKGEGFAIKKTGDATCVLIGFPSVGKSTLLNKLTSASSKVAPFEFTTLTVIPGMLVYQGAKIQILDIPGLISGAAAGKGRGKQILSVVRSADLLLLVVEIQKLSQFQTIHNELSSAGIRINQSPPKINIKKKQKGGLKIISPFSSIPIKTIKKLAFEFRLTNAEIIINEDVSLDQLIDAFSPNLIYLPALAVINKIDLFKKNQSISLIRIIEIVQRYLGRWRGDNLDSSEVKDSIILISAEKELGIEKLKQKIWGELKLIRVYLKPKEGEPDLEKPLILRKGQSVTDALKKLPQNLRENFKSARLWGPSAVYPSQKIGLSHKFLDQDILTIVTK
jgi:small GTP-binding protein